MSANTPQPQDTPEKPEQQLALPGAEELFATVGVEDLPLGAADLTKKELMFALAFVRTGNASASAKEAGYSDPSGNAAKLLKRTDILRFLSPALKEAGKNADAVVQRVAARSRTLHEELMQLREKGDLKDSKRERQLIRLVNQTDQLLGALLGKLSLINIDANINLNGKKDAVPVPASALPAFAQMRREVIEAQRSGTINPALTRNGGPN